ncbi:class I SAM-dependent methyltransferase [Rhabdochromatium marinum]|uniref:class I SAM-dependent methyltransferase n=1 Tax=Rhabdochromatium marinum TaxID=48729 RepID=UPI00190646BA|nr:methyltransferase domain-containing protein [Rhabdochromatium marinum]
MAVSAAQARVNEVLGRYRSATVEQAREQAACLMHDFPDQEPPEQFWETASSLAFRDFFVWGHDHDFGHGVTRSGAMMARHREIAIEGLVTGWLAPDLTEQQVLDVGCWSGGDLLMLAGLGAQVTAIEEHPIAVRATRRLCELLDVQADVMEGSLYTDRRDWAGLFDYIYCAGVIYHVTDPLLFMRLLFAYLKPGGSVFLETKAVAGDGSLCSYSGTLEKGWNWYAPNEIAFGRWLVDAGFDAGTVQVWRRANGRLLAGARKTAPAMMRETAGFSRPGSWLEGVC